MKWGAITRLGLVVLLASQGCSFGTAAIRGKAHVRSTHEYIDAFAFAAAGFGCALAAIAWASPDKYAPVQDDPTSWTSPQDRTNTIETGKTWTPWACTAAVVFLASGLYGHNVKSEDDDTGAGANAPDPDNTPQSNASSYVPPSASASSYSSGYSGGTRESEDDESADSQVTLCENGNQFSCKEMGDAYSTGTSAYSMTPHRINWKLALKFYGKACDYGDEDSCLIAARAYRDGNHVASDQKRAFELFKKACGKFSDKGCADMRALSGSVGRLKYAGGDPQLAWHCGNRWCWADPLSCDAANDGSCHEARTAFCSVVKNGDSLFQPCAEEQSSCEAGLSAAISKGMAKVSECAERTPTVPGQFSGEGWYCADGVGSSSCTRLLALCQPSFGAQCNLQKSAACVVAFDLVNSRYISKCYPSLQDCNYDYSIKSKDDYSERSNCFIAR